MKMRWLEDWNLSFCIDNSVEKKRQLLRFYAIYEMTRSHFQYNAVQVLKMV